MRFSFTKIFVATGALSLGFAAQANRARVSTMGTSDHVGFLSYAGSANASNGSLFYSDDYNFFHNPALLGKTNNGLYLEKGLSDGTSNVEPFGGYKNDFGNLLPGAQYAVFFNRAGGLPAQASAAGNRPIDIYFSMPVSDMNFGLGLTYASATTVNPTVPVAAATEAKFSTSALKAVIGASLMDAEVFIDYLATGKVRTSFNDATARSDGKVSNLGVGAKYNVAGWKPFLGYRSLKVQLENTAAPAAGAINPKVSLWGLGVGRTVEMNARARFNMAASYWTSTSNQIVTWDANGDAAVTATDVSDVITRRLGVDLNVEGNANTWLVLRSGITHFLVDQTKGNVEGTTFGSNLTDPTIRIGAGVKAETFDIDWVFGVGNAAVSNQTNLDSTNLGVSSGLFSNISLNVRM